MTANTGVIRLQPNGPEGIGLEPMDLDPADFQSDLPEQFIHIYHEAPELGVTVGAWTTTDMQEAFGPYPGNEFMVLLEGRVAMVDGDSGETPVEAGESFVIRNAIPISWKQVGFLRKFFIIYDDPNVTAPAIASAEGGVRVLDPAALEAGMAAEAESIGGGSQRDNTVFTDDGGKFTVGMWDSTAFEGAMQPFSVHEFGHILEGAVTITEENGESQVFRAGDTLFVPKGTICSWKSDGYVKKYYAIVDPAAG